MTNFERILRETTLDDMVWAMHECYPGHCDECPAHELCAQQDETSNVTCTEVLEMWLREEARDDK